MADTKKGFLGERAEFEGSKSESLKAPEEPPRIYTKITYPNGYRCIFVMLDEEIVFSTTSQYEANMFREELKAKLRRIYGHA